MAPSRMARGYGGDVYPRIEDNARLGVRFQHIRTSESGGMRSHADAPRRARRYANYLRRVAARLHDL
jgi:hypothetical protein